MISNKVNNINDLEKALKEVAINSNEQKKIIIKTGSYFLSKAIYLTPNHSNLTIEADGEVNIYGGKPIDNWEKKNDKLWCAKLPEIGTGEWDFRMLIINNRFADRARYPEKGYLLHETEFDVNWLSTYEGGFERQPTYNELTTLKYKPADIPESFEPKNAEITVFHMWDESLVGVKAINKDKKEIVFSNPSGWPPGGFAKEHNIERRYVIWNTIEGLLQPGQWFLDRANSELVYWPLENENIDTVKVIAPIIENLVVLNGTRDKPVKNVTLKGIKLSATNAPLMSGAFGAKLFDGALSVRNADNCNFTDLIISNVGAHGIKASGNYNKIQNCSINNCGAGAIRLVGSHALIRNNHIYEVGKTFPSAIALYVGATDPNVAEEWESGKSYTNCKIEHNEIHHVPYAAICAGGKNLKITKNLIYKAMQDLYDGAGIYITFCSNALIKNNVIRDIKDAPGAGTSAYYLDEMTVNAIIEDNIEINVPRPSHNHISNNNMFRNNFFIIDDKGWFTIERSHDYNFENNVVIAKKGFEFFDLKFCPNFKNNILFTPNGKLITKDLERYVVLKEYELELKDGNINQDPKITNYKSGKIEFASDSPAHKMGIKAIDNSDAGLIQ